MLKVRQLMRNLLPNVLAFSAAAAIGLCAGQGFAKNIDWAKQGQAELKKRLAQKPNTGKAKNVILFIGDGMGVSTLTAARILEGQQRGETGEENFLYFESFPYGGLVKTFNTNQQTPDSAGTASAMMTGVKTKAGVLSLTDATDRALCETAKKAVVETLLEKAEKEGLATGIVSTARITHATPAATYAHSPERGWEDDSKLTEEAIKNGCVDIASQLVNFPYGDGLEVAFGGGRRHFIPKTMQDPENPKKTGKRKDGKNLMEEWKKAKPGRAVFTNRSQMMADKGSKQLLGLFSSSHVPYNIDRDKEKDPSLTEMSVKAVEHLKKAGDKGFFLMIEAGRIDHGHHAGSAARALTDAVEFNKAIKAVSEKINFDDTLVMVTADHSHVFTVGGYPTRGNPILGKVVGNDKFGRPKSTPSLDMAGLPYTTLGYTNGPGYTGGSDMQPEGAKVYPHEPKKIFNPIKKGRPDLSKVDTIAGSFMQEATVPLSSETHAAEDVAIYAKGPQAHLFTGLIEQNFIYHVMNHALFGKAE